MIQRDLIFILQQPTYILSELHIILLLLITFIFDYLPSDLQHVIGSWYIIVLFVPVCNSLLYPFSISTFSILISNHTSLRILNVLLISFSFFFSFAAPSGSPDHVPLCYAFPSMEHTTFTTFLPLHLYYSCLSKITPCLLGHSHSKAANPKAR